MLPLMKKIWGSIVDYLYKIAVLLTFIGFVPVILSVYYFLFKEYDPIRVLVNIAVLVVLVNSNIKMQGGN